MKFRLFENIAFIAMLIGLYFVLDHVMEQNNPHIECVTGTGFRDGCRDKGWFLRLIGVAPDK